MTFLIQPTRHHLYGLRVKGLGVEKNKSEAKKAYQKAFELSKKNCAEGDENYCSMVDFIYKKLKKL